MKRFVLSLAVAALSAIATPVASAQVAPTAPDASAERSRDAFSNTELRSFAAAALAVQAIRDAYVVRLADMTDGDQKAQLRQAAAAQMAEAVQQQGLSVARFATILEAARNDEALATRINEQLNASDGDEDQPDAQPDTQPDSEE